MRIIECMTICFRSSAMQQMAGLRDAHQMLDCRSTSKFNAGLNCS